MARIVVLEMPWVLTSVWRLVKSLLPGPAQEMIQFCSKVGLVLELAVLHLQASVGQVLQVEGLPRELGGQDDWQYTWVPEQRGEVEEAPEVK